MLELGGVAFVEAGAFDYGFDFCGPPEDDVVGDFGSADDSGVGEAVEDFGGKAGDFAGLIGAAAGLWFAWHDNPASVGKLLLAGGEGPGGGGDVMVCGRDIHEFIPVACFPVAMQRAVMTSKAA